MTATNAESVDASIWSIYQEHPGDQAVRSAAEQAGMEIADKFHIDPAGGWASGSEVPGASSVPSSVTSATNGSPIVGSKATLDAVGLTQTPTAVIFTRAADAGGRTVTTVAADSGGTVISTAPFPVPDGAIDVGPAAVAD